MQKIALTFALAALAATAQAQQIRREPTPQQQLATTCRYEADVRDLKGSEKNRFVNGCLVAGRRREAEVLKECNAEARGKGGEARRAFMNECTRR